MKCSVDGRTAYAYTGGKPFDPTLPCVVFVHGALHDHSVWNLLARWFAHHGCSVLAVDLPGHGQSDGPPAASVEDAADWLLALLTAAGVQAAALAGHSMGSLIALEAAARAPQRATQLVLLGTAVPMPVSAALLQMAADQPLQAIDMVNALSISTNAAKPSSPGPGTWLHGMNRALMRRVQAQAARHAASAGGGDHGRAGGSVNLFAHDFGICDRYGNGLAAAALVRCPATLVVGARDQMTPPKAARGIAEALHALTVTVAAGHHLMAEAPDAVLQAMRTALAAPVA